MTIGELIKELMRLDVHLPVYVQDEDLRFPIECSVLVHEEEDGKDVVIIR